MGIIENSVKLTIAIGILGATLRIPRGYFFKNWKSFAVLLILGMPLMAFCGAAVAYFILGLNWKSALLIGAIISPTDPIIASSIVTGPLAERYIPKDVRHTISAESGANDGLAYPLVMLFILLFTNKGRHVDNRNACNFLIYTDSWHYSCTIYQILWKENQIFKALNQMQKDPHLLLPLTVRRAKDPFTYLL